MPRDSVKRVARKFLATGVLAIALIVLAPAPAAAGECEWLYSNDRELCLNSAEYGFWACWDFADLAEGSCVYQCATGENTPECYSGCENQYQNDIAVCWDQYDNAQNWCFSHCPPPV